MELYELLAKLILIGFLALLLSCPICSAVVAYAKGRDVFGWAIAGLFFGPFGLIAAAGMPSREPYASRVARRGAASTMKLCGYCCEPVNAEASVCPHCTSVLIEADAA